MNHNKQTNENYQIIINFRISLVRVVNVDKWANVEFEVTWNALVDYWNMNVETFQFFLNNNFYLCILSMYQKI